MHGFQPHPSETKGEQCCCRLKPRPSTLTEQTMSTGYILTVCLPFTFTSRQGCQDKQKSANFSCLGNGMFNQPTWGEEVKDCHINTPPLLVSLGFFFIFIIIFIIYILIFPIQHPNITLVRPSVNTRHSKKLHRPHTPQYSTPNHAKKQLQQQHRRKHSLH